MVKLLILFIFVLSLNVSASQKADAFIVRAKTRYYHVLSPVKIDNKISLIVENKTLTKLIGKLVSRDRGDISHLAINVNKSKSVEFKYDKDDEYFFVPVSPPFQKVILKLGEKSYEIPAQRKD